MSCQYFNISLVLLSITAITVLKMSKGKRMLANPRGLQSTPAQLLAAANIIASAVAQRDLERISYAGPVWSPSCQDLVLDAIGFAIAGAFFCCDSFVFEVPLTLRAGAARTLRIGVSSTLRGGGSCTF